VQCCVVQTEFASPERGKFRANLIAGFGAGLITPINIINFDGVFSNPCIVDSVAVWATIIAFIVLYIPFAVLAYFLDKRDAKKVISCWSQCFVFCYAGQMAHRKIGEVIVRFYVKLYTA